MRRAFGSITERWRSCSRRKSFSSCDRPPIQFTILATQARDSLQLSVVYKFGGSSVATAGRMREVAAIVCSFPREAPVVVLSAMGKVGFTFDLFMPSGFCTCVLN